MFTVKRVAADGEEFAIECRSYVFERVEQSVSWRFMAFDTDFRENGNQTFLSAGVRSGGGPDSDNIYVMNRHGATVATFSFVSEKQQSSGEEQADPEKLAA